MSKQPKVVEGEDNSSGEETNKAVAPAVSAGKRKLSSIRRPIVPSSKTVPNRKSVSAADDDDDEGETVGASVVSQPAPSADVAEAPSVSTPVPLTSAPSAASTDESLANTPSSSLTAGSRLGNRTRLGTSGDRMSWAAKRKAGSGFGSALAAGAGDDFGDSVADAAVSGEGSNQQTPQSPPSPPVISTSGATPRASGGASEKRASMTPRVSSLSASASANSSPNCAAGGAQTKRGSALVSPNTQPLSVPSSANGRKSPSAAPPTSGGRHIPTAVPRYDYDTSVEMLIRSVNGVSNVKPTATPDTHAPSAAPATEKPSFVALIDAKLNQEITAKDVKEAAQKATNAAKAYFEQISSGSSLLAAKNAVANNVPEADASTAADSKKKEPAVTTSSASSSTPPARPKIQELLARPLVRVVFGSSESVVTTTTSGAPSSATAVEASSASAAATAGPSPSALSFVAYEPPSHRLAALHNAATRLSFTTAQHLYEHLLAKNIVAPLAANTHKTDQHAKACALVLKEATAEANAMASLVVTMPIWF